MVYLQTSLSVVGTHGGAPLVALEIDLGPAKIISSLDATTAYHLLDSRRLGPNVFAAEASARMHGVTGEAFEGYSAALFHRIVQAKQHGHQLFHHLKAYGSSQHPAVQTKQNRVDMLSQRAMRSDPRCSYDLKLRGSNE